jgi:cell division protein FtsW (lipid II flippase)
VLVAAALGAVLAGCGSDDEAGPTTAPAGYQQNQSRIVIGSGQRTTNGNLRLQPETHTDYVVGVR